MLCYKWSNRKKKLILGQTLIKDHSKGQASISTVWVASRSMACTTGA